MLPLQDTNGVDVLTGSIVRPAGDLGIPAGLTALQVVNATPINTGIGCTNFVTCKTASGAVICKTAVAAASGSLSFSATGATFNSSTTQTVITSTTLANPWLGIQLTDSGTTSGLAGATFVVLSAYGYTTGENWHSAKVGYLGCASLLRGDGTGGFSSLFQ